MRRDTVALALSALALAAALVLPVQAGSSGGGVVLSSAGAITFAAGTATAITGPSDVALVVTAAASRGLTLGAAEGQVTKITGIVDLPGDGAKNGETFKLQSLSEITTLSLVASTTDTTFQVPAGALILAVSYRCTTQIDGVTSCSLGTTASTTLFWSGVGSIFTAGATKTNCATAYNSPTSAVSLRITFNATPTAGAVRFTCWYLVPTAATG